MNAIKIKGSPARGLAAATLGFFFGSAAISLFGPSATKLNEVMELSPSMLGVRYSKFLFGFIYLYEYVLNAVFHYFRIRSDL